MELLNYNAGALNLTSVNTAGTHGWTDFNSSSNGTTVRTNMVIDNAGNVGIGTTGPGVKLEVASASAGTAAMIRGVQEGSDGIISSLHFRNPSGIATIDARRETDNYGTRLDFSTGLANASGGADSNTNIRMTINNAGNVGIGTTSPGGILDIGTSAAGILCGPVSRGLRFPAAPPATPPISNWRRQAGLICLRGHYLCKPVRKLPEN